MCLFMENRWHTRKKITLDVQLIQRDHLIFNAKTINISMGGMYVQTDTTGLDEKTSLGILLYQRSKNKIKHYRINAYVIYKNEIGVGLMFYSHDSAVTKMLYHLLNENYSNEYKNDTIYGDASSFHNSAIINQ